MPATTSYLTGGTDPSPDADRQIKCQLLQIWKAFNLQPHRTETFKLSTDPLFVEKVRDIVGLYLALEDIDHSRTKTKSPQTNGIFERFHETVLDEFYRIAFRKKIYGSIADLQVDLDRWVQSYNEERPHQGRWCFGKTPMQTFLDATPLAKEKMIAA